MLEYLNAENHYDIHAKQMIHFPICRNVSLPTAAGLLLLCNKPSSCTFIKLTKAVKL